MLANVLAQIGRRRCDRYQRIHGTGRRRRRTERVRRKAAFEQLGCFDRATYRRLCAQHHGNQALAASRCGGDEIETGGAGEAGLHAVGARIGVNQPVGVPVDALAELDRRDVPVIIIFGKFEDQGTGEDCEVARRSDLLVRRQAVGIYIVRLCVMPR